METHSGLMPTRVLVHLGDGANSTSAKTPLMAQILGCGSDEQAQGWVFTAGLGPALLLRSLGWERFVGLGPWSVSTRRSWFLL